MAKINSIKIMLDMVPDAGKVRLSDVVMLNNFSRPMFKGQVLVVADGEVVHEIDAPRGVILPPPEEMGREVIIRDDRGVYLYLA